MPALSFAPALSLLAAFGQVSPVQPLRTLIRTTSRRFNPPRLETLSSVAGPAVRSALARGLGGVGALATVRREAHRGARPTIVLGGFVPDACEQVYLLRGFLARQGSIYFVDYAKGDFSLELIGAQLEDLVTEVIAREGAAPVIVAVSFGAGVVLDWLRRARLNGRTAPTLAGLILISPVCCAEDIVAPGETKPSTLLGRALKPMLDAPEHASDAAVEKARSMFARMFEAGAQNKLALATLMTKAELSVLRAKVLSTIAGITPHGALTRVRAMAAMASPTSYLTPELLPLADAPALILYAEKEGSVLSQHATARPTFERACSSFFPRGRCLEVANPRGTPVQHASLIFHFENFLPHFARFYRSLKPRKVLEAA
jgi:hypothetical protein